MQHDKQQEKVYLHHYSDINYKRHFTTRKSKTNISSAFFRSGLQPRVRESMENEKIKGAEK